MTYQPKIAIIIPTINGDSALMDTIESILEHMEMQRVKIIIVDQTHPDCYSDTKKIFYGTAASSNHTSENEKIYIKPLGYNCGAGYARNEGIKIAKRERIPYILMANDNIKFNKSMSKIEDLIPYLGRYDVLGLGINNYTQKVGKLDLIKGSHFDFQPINTSECKACYKKIVIFNTDIVDNFYLTNTSLYGKLRYDDSLKTFEKEDFFIRLKWGGFKVGFSKFCNGDYIKGVEADVKKHNLITGKQRLNEKYHLKG